MIVKHTKTGAITIKDDASGKVMLWKGGRFYWSKAQKGVWECATAPLAERHTKKRKEVEDD